MRAEQRESEFAIESHEFDARDRIEKVGRDSAGVRRWLIKLSSEESV
jgi:hypothetical protein